MCLKVKIYGGANYIDSGKKRKWWRIILPSKLNYPSFYRQPRETPWAVTNHGAAIGKKEIVFRNGNHQLEATLLAGRKWISNDHKLGHFTGRMDYKNKESGASGHVQADKIGMGIYVSTGFKYSLFQSEFVTVNLNGHFGQYFSGARSKGRPQYGASISFNLPILGN